MPKRSKKILKLRRYRDKLIADNVNLRAHTRSHIEMFRQICKALASKESTLRAYAIATHGINDEIPHEDDFNIEFVEKNEAIAELTLVYKMLSVEREFTIQISMAASQRDYLRVAALASDHVAEQAAHDKMLSTWSKDHGFTKSLREECNEN